MSQGSKLWVGRWRLNAQYSMRMLLAFENFDDKMSTFFQVEEEASKSIGTQTIAASDL